MKYSLKRMDGCFEIEFEIKKHNNKYKIDKHIPFYRTDAYIYDDVFGFLEIEEFDSFIKAVKFLKENIENLM